MEINLIEKPEYIYNYLQGERKKLPPPYNNLINIFIIEKASYYQFKGVKFRLIKYKGILKNKKGISFYIYATSKKHKRIRNRWLFLNYLYNHNFSVPPFLVNKPIIFAEKYNFFLYEERKGKTLFQYIKENKFQELQEGIFKAAQWLLKFHGLKIENQKIFTSNDLIEENEFRHYLEIARKFFPKNYYQKIKKILFQIHNHTKLYSKKQISLIHGDFQPPNIVFNKKNETLTVIDFEWSAIGDPLSDVGNFLIQFDYHGASIFKKKEIINLKKKFLNSYLRKNFFRNVAQRVNLYQAKFAIQRAMFNTEFILPHTSRHENDPTINFLLKKAENCYNEKDNINLTVYPYHQ